MVCEALWKKLPRSEYDLIVDHINGILARGIELPPGDVNHIHVAYTEGIHMNVNYANRNNVVTIGSSTPVFQFSSRDGRHGHLEIVVDVAAKMLLFAFILKNSYVATGAGRLLRLQLFEVAEIEAVEGFVLVNAR